MGLDMYAYTVDAEDIGDQQVDIKLYDDKGEPLFDSLNREFAYWRKFNNLHQWMADLYYKKGGTSMPFNCNTVRLMPADLDKLWADAPGLEPSSGFFWGSEDKMTEDDINEVKEFVSRSMDEISIGKAVIYDSWW